MHNTSRIWIRLLIIIQGQGADDLAWEEGGGGGWLFKTIDPQRQKGQREPCLTE